jgi:hypothetical protein
VSETEKSGGLKVEPNGKVRIVNVSHHDVGGYDFNKDGKIDGTERFDARPGVPIEVSPKRAELLLREDTAGEFYPEAKGMKVWAERQEEAKRKAKKAERAAKE